MAFVADQDSANSLQLPLLLLNRKLVHKIVSIELPFLRRHFLRKYCQPYCFATKSIPRLFVAVPFATRYIILCKQSTHFSKQAKGAATY